MKILILGAGFTGLTSALRLLEMGHSVEVIEKESAPGGLAVGVKLKDFQWSIEKHYHHLFTNDLSIINLMKNIGAGSDLIFPPSLTSIFYKDKIYPFNLPQHILSFPPLSITDRSRLALVSAFLKLLPRSEALHLEKYTATSWIRKFYGPKVFDIVWNPLLTGKFGPYVQDVNMAWFWARIKKRTFKLGYIKGGFQTLAEKLSAKVISLGGKIRYNSTFQSDPAAPAGGQLAKFDKLIITTPTSVFLKLFPQLPKIYTQNLGKIPHLHALNLLLILKKQFLKDGTYWLNINDRKFPFIAVVEHTNYIDPKYYGNNHLVYVGNYLPTDHPYLKMSKEQLLKLFIPYLKKINPSFNYELRTINYELFLGPFAQPVFPINYSKHIPNFQTPLKNVYLANMDMVYPWDRGTNYAVELGEKVAKFVNH
ncbi:hypothetical protein A2773_00455 [Candidatus Gottesmanbacteria bacterium RIFCSPHIGHO2_01_FULL_39_10]|uniref:Amine oxidase domain-containing protein n=1 Tax=Candidatus Gottesmanbacteria bacterium RIFCSPHIGHO2_01_FULL_39_10 TaxID=1798375 RepID=A0A1F5ZM07_9BACT|nr:MAG: hypothetical protein A2773_00455 [Candidatus Gottesmanbacteria bacterium RIFCSPHIGHO2_01_FULL_39_10]